MVNRWRNRLVLWNWLFGFRGFIDKLYGGVGSRRGRTNKHDIHAGDSLDFGVCSMPIKKRETFAEMKLPEKLG
jgi:hypothetical protein